MSSADKSVASNIGEQALQDFKNALQGQTILPGDAAYDGARQIWNGMVDKRPAVIARCANTSDVVASDEFARTNHLALAVRGGGHNIAGNALCDGGVVVDFSLLKSVSVDPHARTAHVEPGAVWREFDQATQNFGLVTP